MWDLTIQFCPNLNSGEPSRWRHNERGGISNHQPHGCLLIRLFRRRPKKTSKFCVTDLCEGNSPVTRNMFAFDDVIMTSNLALISRAWYYKQASQMIQQYNSIRVDYFSLLIILFNEMPRKHKHMFEILRNPRIEFKGVYIWTKSIKNDGQNLTIFHGTSNENI